MSLCTYGRRRHHVPRNALRNPCGRDFQRLLREVCVSGGGLDLPVASSLPIIGRLSPSASARDAKLCLKSWILTSLSPARSRTANHLWFRFARRPLAPRPEMTHGLPG